jgi:Fe2+ or Zn2+ uptake regulation protein
MKASDVLLCLSLEEQRIEAIFDRLAERGHMADLAPVRKILKRYTTEELVVTRKQANGACFYRLAEGEAVEVALNEAWAKAEAEQSRNEQPES